MNDDNPFLAMLALLFLPLTLWMFWKILLGSAYVVVHAWLYCGLLIQYFGGW